MRRLGSISGRGCNGLDLQFWQRYRCTSTRIVTGCPRTGASAKSIVFLPCLCSEPAVQSGQPLNVGRYRASTRIGPHSNPTTLVTSHFAQFKKLVIPHDMPEGRLWSQPRILL